MPYELTPDAQEAFGQFEEETAQAPLPGRGAGLGFSTQDPEERLSPFPAEGPTEGANVPFDFSGITTTGRSIPSDIAFPRALKWAHGLNANSDYQKHLFNMMLAGREADEEATVRQQERTRDLSTKQASIQRILADRQGKGLRREDIGAIQHIEESELAASEDVFAARYAEKIVNTTAESFFKNTKPEEHDFKAMDYAQKSIYLKEATQRLAEDMTVDYQATGMVNKTLSKGERFIPLLFDARMKTEFFALTGNDLMKQYDRYMLMNNPDEAMREIKDIAQKMYHKNPEAAIQFLHGFANFTSSDAALANLFSTIDFAAPFMGVTAGMVYRKWSSVVKAAGNRSPNFIRTLEAQGDINDASKIIAAEQLEKAAARQGVPSPAGQIPAHALEDSLKELRNETTTMQQGVQALERAGTAYPERSRRIAEEMQERTRKAEDQIVKGPVKVQRIEQESNALALGADEADKIVYRKYPNAADRVVDLSVSKLDDGLTSNYFRVMQLGERGDPRVPAVPFDLLRLPSGRPQWIEAVNENFKNALITADRPLLGKSEQAKLKKYIEGVAKAWMDGDKKLANKLQREADAWFEKTTGVPPRGVPGDPGYGTPSAILWSGLNKGEGTKITSLNLRAANENFPLPPRPSGATTSVGKKLEDLKFTKDIITSTLGDDTLKPFKTRESAIYSAEREIGLHPKAYQVVDKDGGHVIEIKHPIDETSITVRNELAVETKHDNPPGLLRFFTSLLPLSKDSKLATNMMEAAKLAGYGVKGQQELIKEFLKPIYELKGGAKAKDWDDFKAFLNDQKLYKKDDEYGRFSRSFAEFQQDYNKFVGRLPTEIEERAYWAYVQLNDLDWIINNLAIYRDKTRQGREMFGLAVAGQSSKDVINNIEGKLLLKHPWDSPTPFGYVLYEKGEGKAYRSDRPVAGQKAFHAQIRKEIEAGRLKVIQIDPHAKDILVSEYGMKLPKTSIDYIITSEIHSQPLAFRQLPYKPGGHRTYDHPWVARVANIMESGEIRKTTFYYGDLNHSFFSNRKDADYYAKHFNKARELFTDAIASGNMSALDAYLGRHLGHSRERFVGFFDGYGGQLPLDQELRITPAGKSIDSEYKLVDNLKEQYPLRNFVRAGESPHNLNNGQINLRFADERGDPLNIFEVAGNKRNPVYNFRPAATVDPFVAAHRAAETIANARILDDVRIKAVERFIAEFGRGLEWDVARQRANPLQAFLESPVRAGANLADRMAISDARRATKELIGMNTYFENGVNALQQKIYEAMFQGTKVENIPAWMLWTIKNPLVAMRTAAYHLKLGMWNPATFYNQAQAINGIASVLGPTHALKAATASTQAYLFRSWKDNPAMLSSFAKNLEKMGMWKASHFEEAANALHRTRYDEVGREVADWNQWLNLGVTETKLGQVMETGNFFMKRGEEVGRYNSWFGAYSEWRTKNPTAEFGSAEIAEVLNRADTLNLSMSGVSNSVLQKGMPGIMTQFFHAHLRQAELLGSATLGSKRITGTEAARLVTWNSIVYGLPVGLGGALTAGLWPIKSEISRSLIENQIDPSDHLAFDAIMNGVVAVAWERAGGQKIDFGGSGLGGISLLRDIYEKEKSYWDVFTGAGGRAMKGVIKSFYPFYDFVASTGQRPLTQADFSDILENVSLFTAGQKMWYGFTLGQYLGRNENRLENITGAQAVMLALTGTQPQSIQDMYDVSAIIKHKDAVQKDARQEYSLHIRRAFQALDKDDVENHALHMDRANRVAILGGFRQDELPRMMRDALQDNAPLVERAHTRLMMRLRDEKAFEYYVKFLEKRGL